MKILTGYETENFRLLDKKEYILEENKDFLNWYLNQLKNGYKPVLDITELQDIINEIVSFFEFKYHDNFFYDLFYIADKDKQFNNSKKLSKYLGIEELKYILHHDYTQFLECNYPRYFKLTKEKEHLWDLSEKLIFVSKDGCLRSWDLENLEENEYLPSKKGIVTVEDLLDKYLSINTKVNYSDLENLIYQYNVKVELRNKVLELIPLALLYSKNTNPKYGYIRAKSFIRMFNKEYNLNMTTSKIDEIISIDYTNIQEKQKEVVIEKKEKPKTRVRRLIDQIKSN